MTTKHKDFISFCQFNEDKSQIRIDIDITGVSGSENIYSFVKSLPKHPMGGNDLGGVRVWFWGGGILFPKVSNGKLLDKEL